MNQRIPADVKAEVVNYCREGVQVYMIAEHFDISESSVRRIWKNYHDGRFQVRSIYQPNAKGVLSTYFRVFDRTKRKMLGDCHPNPETAEKALYGYL